MAPSSVEADVKVPGKGDTDAHALDNISSMEVGATTNINLAEYTRFLSLNEEFSGEKLRKLIRKCE